MSELPAPTAKDAPYVTLYVFFENGENLAFHDARVTVFTDALRAVNKDGTRETTIYLERIAGWMTDSEGPVEDYKLSH
jgi:hypothetical protein